MRVALLYPPPWKIAPVEAPAYLEDGPPLDFAEGDLDADFFQVPYGLLSLAAQATAAGHQVKIANLSNYPWNQVEAFLAELDAQVVGLSCWTANRRGVALVARELKRLSPQTQIVIGGPHATPLAREMLEHHAEIDTVVVGEGEQTFLELLDRLEHRQPLAGLAGAWIRHDGEPKAGPPRAAIAQLDDLVSPHELFGTHIVMTSRGCPWACTFCGAETSWGRGFRGRSIPKVLDALEQALELVPVKMLLLKDDTFTANRKRVLELCDGILKRNLKFLWSCDTRVDVLGEELLHAMRLAGCERLSLGVESGSSQILTAIHKKITTTQILEATAAAKKFGVKVRYYMMLGNRGETRETFRETLDFLRSARPHQYVFSCLSVYPGTEDFQAARQLGWLEPQRYFEESFQELKVPFDATPEFTAELNSWFEQNRGVQRDYRAGVEELEATTARLDGHHAAEVELAEALIVAGCYAEAEQHLNLAEQRGYPLPGILHNARACIAHAQGNYEQVKNEFVTAARKDPQHPILLRNAAKVQRWFQQGGPQNALPLSLEIEHDFELLERWNQPMLPGPLPSNWQDWSSENTITPSRRAEHARSTPPADGLIRLGLRRDS